MSDDVKQAQAVVKIFTNLVTQKQDRLQRGLMLRQLMHDAIARGENPDSYRARWVRSSALKLIEALGAIAGDFDSTYPDDRCSGSDLLDILTTTIGLIKSNAS